MGFTTSVTAKDIVAAVKAVPAAQGKIVVLATVAAKAESSALLTAAHELNVPIVSFAPDVLARVQVPSPSPRVENAVGTASVAEAAAILASGGGRLVLAKTARDGVTVAAARKVPSSLTNSDNETECE
ncbi:cobalamin biosynthesis protein [Rhodococcus qingshengii]|uniref:cobalamin biosynthesis protein n=1 Tax=Rhodococcus TaxID=1827 RepID=UPI0001A212F2|nr:MULTISPECIES: cobalamin biosynthesis protein [Rhodococcus]AZI65122.1 cobalamin biosynthesis protein [Rhodococcus sp. NJ-530]EEN87474.1 cobalamin biosynthesis protein CbiG [Rhodococcus erythropolis SK121]NRH35646.1 cobalamin biosynthesis protein [Rhodococcus sp. MS13]AUS35326.1 cobalamin biosynthesis protein CbiG [Rhodococcus qingshengii]KDQ00937.1 cobalamin biosynthesis protein CbiG [Rhodococcus qingshengii]